MLRHATLKTYNVVPTIFKDWALYDLYEGTMFCIHEHSQGSNSFVTHLFRNNGSTQFLRKSIHITNHAESTAGELIIFSMASALDYDGPRHKSELKTTPHESVVANAIVGFTLEETTCMQMYKNEYCELKPGVARQPPQSRRPRAQP